MRHIITDKRLNVSTRIVAARLAEKQEGLMKSGELAEELGLNLRTVQRGLRQLRDLGLVETEACGRWGLAYAMTSRESEE